MFDHITFQVSDFGRSTAFYDAALGPLGLRRLFDPPGARRATGYGADRPFFWIVEGGGTTGVLHVALLAPDRAAVKAFHAAAMAAGGHDNGAPGERAHYHPGYYGAFVLDPDGFNVEAVHHG